MQNNNRLKGAVSLVRRIDKQLDQTATDVIGLSQFVDGKAERVQIADVEEKLSIVKLLARALRERLESKLNGHSTQSTDGDSGN
jgi:hypothetical protein